MKKNALCFLMTIVMVMCIITNVNILNVKAVDDDPRISFDANGGSGYMATVYTQGNYPLPECEFTAPEGYQFKCWHRDGDTRELQPGDTVYVGSTDTVVNAVWEPIPAKIVFNNGGGTGTMDDVEIYGDYSLPNCEFTAPDGQQFMSWKLDDQEKQPGDSIYVDGIITVTALWENIPTEAPTETPIPPLNNGNADDQVNDLANSDNSADNDSTQVIIIAVSAVLICVVCVVGSVVIVLLIIKNKKK